MPELWGDRAQRWSEPPDYRDDVLRTVSWVVRAVAILLVGVNVFSAAKAGPVALPVTIAAFALCSLLMSGWAVLDAWGDRAAQRSWLPWALGGVAAVSGAVAPLPQTGTIVALGVVAAVGAGSELRLPAGWAVFGAGVVAIEAGVLITGGTRDSAIAYPLMLAVGLLIGHNRRSYRIQAEQTAALLANAEQLRVEQSQVAALDERTRIAREIHDVLAHSLGALGIQIQAAKALLTDDRDVERAVGVLTVAQRIASDGLTETHRAVHALRTDTLPLDQELVRMAVGHGQQHDIPVSLDIGPDAVELGPEATLAMVRTAQESLTNAAKHAPERPVSISLSYGEYEVELTIANDLDDAGGWGGSGGFMKSGRQEAVATIDGGYGLTGMRERLLLLGGALSVSSDGGRWIVSARVPARTTW